MHLGVDPETLRCTNPDNRILVALKGLYGGTECGVEIALKRFR